MRVNAFLDAGITSAMKIANVAEGFGIDVEFHGSGPAHRHCMAATRNTNYHEMGLIHPDWDEVPRPPVYSGNYEDSLYTADADGTVPIPTGPELGVDTDLAFIESNEVARRHFA